MKNHKINCMCCICKQKRGEFITEEIRNNMSISQKERHSNIWKDNQKLCPKCKIYKPLSEYYKSNCKSHSKGIYTYCIECTKKKNKNRERKRSYTTKEAYGDYRRNAKKRGLVFNLSYEDIDKLIHSNCYYCGKSVY